MKNDSPIRSSIGFLHLICVAAAICGCRSLDQGTPAPNLELTDSLKQLEFLTTSWTMRQSVQEAEGSWRGYPPREFQGEASLRGTLIQAEVELFVGGKEILPVRFLWSWDGGRSVYRMVVIDSEFGYLDVFQGAKDDDGDFVLTNAKNGTHWGKDDNPMWGRWRIVFENENAFHWGFDVSTDHGHVWGEAMRFEFTRSLDDVREKRP